MSPPTEDELVPTFSLIDPEGPFVDAPVLILIAPDASPVACPELMEIDPLAPFTPPLPELTETSPLTAAELLPLVRRTLPPVIDADLPA
jgi:hypothetical protein